MRLDIILVFSALCLVTSATFWGRRYSGSRYNRFSPRTYDRSSGSSRNYQYGSDRDRSVSSGSTSYQRFQYPNNQNNANTNNRYRITVRGDNGKVYSGPQNFEALRSPTNYAAHNKQVVQVNHGSGGGGNGYVSGPKGYEAVPKQPKASASTPKTQKRVVYVNGNNEGVNVYHSGPKQETETAPQPEPVGAFDTGYLPTGMEGSQDALAHHRTPVSQSQASQVNYVGDTFLDTTLFDALAGRPGEYIRYDPSTTGRETGSQLQSKLLDFPQVLQQYSEY